VKVGERMGFWPKSIKARRRLTLFLWVAPILIAAVGLTLYALRDSVVYFYTPGQAVAAGAPLNTNMRLGGLVAPGSVVKNPDGSVTFEIMDNLDAMTVTYQGDLPDLFREGQGVVCEGKLTQAKAFKASTVLAKHDETYMPKEVTKALKEQGEWRPNSEVPTKAAPL
jgi:cytochrome c-type biogenesis protein CcmE